MARAAELKGYIDWMIASTQIWPGAGETRLHLEKHPLRQDVGSFKRPSPFTDRGHGN